VDGTCLLAVMAYFRDIYVCAVQSLFVSLARGLRRPPLLHSLPQREACNMLDHVTIGVSNIERSKRFYDTALKPLGIARLYADDDTFSGYGMNRKAFFWIGLRASVLGGVHVAFAAKDRATVDAFHAAAQSAGGRDNGAPGLRPHYHANYYGAFVFDPDGHNIEAVCRSAA
jgi:catechol 2,3-dioxygenase-like lactoylglutathione lyase family enzyme